MNHTTLNRWLKPLAILLVIVLIVMLLIPGELTDEQLAQIKPGMTLAEVKRLLGEPFEGRWSSSSMAEPVEGADTWGSRWTHLGQFWKPTISFIHHSSSLNKQYGIWIGKTRLLWVEHDNDIATKTWMFPITRYGGGLEGCISSLKYYWKRQTGTLTTSTSPQAR